MSSLIPSRFARRLLPPGARVLVGCSGGADSQALLHALASSREPLEIELFALGVDHGLRSEAAAELNAAKKLCKRLDVPFRLVRVDVPATGNLMANARRSRHRALRLEARRIGADRIALGHTATDVAETLLMHLARGASLRGAGSMGPKRGRLVRPLLRATRAEVRAYCERLALPFHDDPSNDSVRFDRPYVRHAVLPALRGLRPDAERALARFAQEARRAESSLQRQARGFFDSHRQQLGPWCGAPVAVPVERLTTLDRAIASRVIRILLEEFGIRLSESRVQRILGGLARPGFGLRFGARAVVGVDRGQLWGVQRPAFRVALGEGGPPEAEVPPWGARLRTRLLPVSELKGFPGDQLGVAFDAEALHLPLLMRPWTRGDVVRCFGAGHRAKVGDLFTNAKIPRPLRSAWPVVTHGEETVWVMGLRRSDFAPVTSKTRTVRVLELDAAPNGYAY